LEQRSVLEHMRSVITATCPEAVEAIGYGIPGYKVRGRPLVSIAAWKGHLSYYGGYGVIKSHAAELADFDIKASTIRFTADRPLPDKLVRAMVQERVAEIEADLAKPKTKKR
ncbi:MAG: DUF1801 domain-containing protein, partial [Chloroflexota bacterium]